MTDLRGRQAFGVCPDCGKLVYLSRGAAKRAAAIQHPGVRLRAYQCRESGAWHLTSRNAARTAAWRDWDQA